MYSKMWRASGPWAGYEPRSIGLAGWSDRWLLGMQADGKLVAVFPTPADQGVVATPDRIKSDLDEEVAQYE